MKRNSYSKGNHCRLCAVAITNWVESLLCKSCAAKGIKKKETLKLKCEQCLNTFETYPSRTNQKYCSTGCRNTSNIGKKMSVAWCKRQSEQRSGERSHFWKGGITPENKLARSTSKYKEWREAVFRRDDFTCQHCEKRGCELHADHIKPFAIFKDIRFSLDNGRTLCVPCHKKTDSYAGKYHKNYRDFAS